MSTGEKCIKKTVACNLGNFYITTSRSRVDITIPGENWPENADLREAVEKIQEAINDSLTET